MLEKVDVIEELKETGYEVLLLSSFSSDLVFFERVILRHLLENNCRYIGLFLDGKMVSDNFEQLLLEIGKSYAVQPIYGKGAFHPKVYLLLGEQKAKVIIGSGNLTPAGFITNTEVFNVIRFNKDTKEFISIIQEVFQFFLYFHKKETNYSLKKIISFCEKYAYLTEPSQPHPALSFLHNGFHSLHKQLKPKITEAITEIDVITPYFDRALSVQERWLRDFQPLKINYLVQDKTSNFPKHLPLKEKTSRYLLDFTDSEHKNKRYHGKVFLFNGNEEDVVVYGSANFSSPALLKSFSEDGNAEAVIVEKRAKGSFASFFEDEINRLEMPETLLTLEDDFDANDHNTVNVQFIEAYKNSRELTMVLKSVEEITEVMIDGAAGALEKFDSIYIVKWEKEFELVTSVFQYAVTINEENVLLSGWLHDIDALTDSQNNKALAKYKYLEQDPYLTDYQNLVNILEDLLERLTLTEEDLETKHTLRKKPVSIESKLEMKDEVPPVSEDIDDYYVSEEEINNEPYGAISGVDVIDKLINQFLKPLFDKNNDSNRSKKDYSSISPNPEGTHIYDEGVRKNLHRQMKRFASRFREGITATSYLDKVPEDVLITNITLYNQFLLKMFLLKSDVPYVSKKELIEEQYNVMVKMIEYGKKNIIQHHYMSDILLPQSLAVIVAKDVLIEEEDNISVMRNQRKYLKNHLFDFNKYIAPLTEYYQEHTTTIKTYLETIGFNFSNGEIIRRLDHLIPFTTISLFIKWLQEKDMEYEIDEVEGVTVRISTNLRMGASFNLDQLMCLGKILSVEEWDEESSISIEYINKDISLNLEKYILDYHKDEKVLKKSYIYRNHLKPNISKKTSVFIGSVIDAAEKGESQFIGNGFK